jgi:hypothetical protein
MQMQEEINALKSQLIAHREDHPNRRSMPTGLWPRIKKLAEHLSTEEIADALEINLLNLRRRLGRQKSKKTPSQSPFVKLATSAPTPQKTVLKISISDQVTIEVYS